MLNYFNKNKDNEYIQTGNFIIQKTFYNTCSKLYENRKRLLKYSRLPVTFGTPPHKASPSLYFLKGFKHRDSSWIVMVFIKLCCYLRYDRVTIIIG